jgi:cytochrome c-type biogenesis protein CcmH/NrfG
LRAIARDPDHAKGYEYLALHFWKQGRTEEARRLFRLAQRLPGSTLAREFLERIEEESKPAPQPASPPSTGDNF